MKNILVTGSNGQLGSELRQLSSIFPQFNFAFTTRKELDVSELKAVEKYFSTNSIDAVINCAAYTAVDKAETDQKMAYAINSDAVGFLANRCKMANAFMVHVSTDYVFNGQGTIPYTTDAPTSPLGVYGRSKLAGEKLFSESGVRGLVIRTSWVYSSFGNNFVKTMLRLGADRSVLNVVSDQLGCPTYAADLARSILDILVQEIAEIQLPAIYHYSNAGAISWFDFATAIMEEAGLACQVSPIPSSAYPTPAERPAYSVFDSSKIAHDFGLTILPWRASLQACLKNLHS